MSQPSLLDLAPRFDGCDVTPADQVRLTGQLARIYAVLTQGGLWTVASLARVTGFPEPSISAQLRNLRKPRFGGHDVQRIRVNNLTYYRLAGH